MLVKIICLITVGIISVQGYISSSIITDDAEKLTQVYLNYLEHAPYKSIRGKFKTSCRIMSECCPDKRSNFYNLMRTDQFERICIGDRTSTLFEFTSEKCRGSVRDLDEIKSSSNTAKLYNAIKDAQTSGEPIQEWREQMSTVCSPEELESYYCEPDNTEKFQSCQEKVLRMVADKNHGRDYDIYVREFKNRYNLYINSLSKVFPNLP